MSDEGRLLKESMVQFERLLPGPIERVWEFLTKSEQITQWLGNGSASSIEPRLGGAVNIGDGHIRGVVTQWKPPRLLAYTWNVFGPGETESPFPESYLTFELKPQNERVLLTLKHRPVLADFEGRTLMGWHTLLEMLAAQLRGEKSETRDVLMEKNRIRYGVEKFSI
jgi:uncharacterized protein YndB with AHSA1/START domain